LRSFTFNARKHFIAGVTMRDDDFEPKLGRLRSNATSRERSYLQRVLHSAAKAGGRHGRSNRGFNGSRIGRGAGIVRVLGARRGSAAVHARRVVVQARIVKLAGKGMAGARAHLRYIQRDGVTRSGERGELYDREQDKADGRAFVERADGDRHQFRFIVSPEDGDQYDDLKPVVRRLMARVEKDLDTKLDWVAADHYNTGHPHSHIIVRGKDDTGKDLIIARDYITAGLRERAAEIVSLDLGPRSDLEIQTILRKEMDRERFTSIDRDFVRDRPSNGEWIVRTSARDPFRQTLQAGRLKTLECLGLATDIGEGRWTLRSDMEAVLRQMGERGDIIKTMQRALAHEAHAPDTYPIYEPSDSNAQRLVGRVAAFGLADELHDHYYAIVEATDGRNHYVSVGLVDPFEFPSKGAIVAIDPVRATATRSDLTVAAIATARDGQYSAALHAQFDAGASPEFVQSHLRRLEALRRAGVAVERQPDGNWTIPPDHVSNVERYARAQTQFRPVRIETLSSLPIEQQVTAEGATWLDRELVRAEDTEIRDAGFGHETREAMARRRQWLIAQGFARDEDGRTAYPTGMVAELQRRELAKAGAQIATDRRLPYIEAEKGDRITGIYKRRIDLASGRFAVIENSREFTLVPWRSVLKQSIGKEVSGVVRGDTISWTLGRQRSGPSVA
jgi:type IV secretory pathway VirD2 relaxase